MKLVTASQMQQMDAQTINSFGIPGLVLMENAGRGSVDFLLESFQDIASQRVAVMAGRGNNGGDGFVIARYLLEKGINVTVFLLASAKKVTGDALSNLEWFETLCKEKNINGLIEIPDEAAFAANRARIAHHTLFVDAILGTGLNSDVRGFFKDAIELMNASLAPVFSVDIPSGLNSDTGSPMGIAVRADYTATFAFAKAGHVLYPGNTYTGQLKVIDIGIPRFISEKEQIALEVITPQKVAANFPARDTNAHKGSFGHLLVVAGSTGKTGAAALCANAAMRSGTGLVTLGTPESLNPVLEPMVIEPMTIPLPDTGNGTLSAAGLKTILELVSERQALAVGPGIGTAAETADLVKHIVQKCPVPMVLDADALNCIADDPSILKKKTSPAILTPHPGEMARLADCATSQVQNDRIGSARAFADRHDSILVLKGAQTIVALPDGMVFICPTGNPGMATGGSGDVLTGMIGGFLAQGFAPEDAAVCGVYLHGLCGDILAKKTGSFGFLASDIMNTIPEAIHGHLL